MPELGQVVQGKSGGAGGNVLQLVSFKVGNEEFGLEILKVQEIIRLRELTRVPNMPDFVDGVINLRGKVIPVIGLRRRMGIATGEADKRTRIVVAEVNGRVLGFVVDEVSEVLRISADTVVLARSRISFTFHVSPSVLLMLRMCESP